MTSTRAFPSSLSSSPRQLDETPIAALFATTLRAFAQEEAPDRLRPRPSPAVPIEQKRPLTTRGSLLRGPEKIADRKSMPPKVPASKAKPSPAEKPPSTEKPTPIRKPSRPQSPFLLARAWRWLQKQNTFSAKKQLRVCETVSLGEKRFVAVVQIDGQKFLIGGGASGVSLLAELESESLLDGSSALDNGETPEAKVSFDRNLRLDGEEISREEISRVLQPIACARGRSR